MSETKQNNSADDQSESLISEELESLFEDFESAWVKTPYPDLRSYLSTHSTQADSEFRTALLVELIQIDLERRWKSDGNVAADDPLPARPHVKDYVSVLAEFSDVDDVPIELLAFEFRVRHLWGDCPGVKDFAGQFPQCESALTDACEEAVAELARVGNLDVPAVRTADLANEATHIESETDNQVAPPKSPEHSFRSLSQGIQISHYTLRRQIGKGGFGVVFEAANLDRPYQQCAIKLIRPDRVARPKLAERFKQEITALTALSHPNIACATDHGEWQGVVYLVLEYVDGLPVNRLVRRGSELSVADSCELVRQAAVGLQHIHEKLRTHRDIKPSNLIVTTDGVVKILDLGMARLTDIEDQEERLTSIGDVIGTPDYMAPEQWQDSGKVDIRGDIYSLGCTLYCLLAGQPPFAGRAQFDPVALMRAHSESSVPDIAAHREDVPEEVRKLIADCMAKKTDDRPAEPQDVANRLAPFVAESNLATLNEPPAIPTSAPAVQASSEQAIVEPTEGAAVCPSDNETIIVEPTPPVASEMTAVDPTGSADVKNDSSNAATGDSAKSEDTLFEATKVPSLEETLIQQGVDPNSTLAKQSIKPQNRATSTGSQSAGSTSSMSRSYSESGSVVLTLRQVTYGEVSGVTSAEYEIGAMLGEGGMGAVYRARQSSVDRGVALKMVKKDQATADAQDKFLAEAVVTGALEHPNIVPIYDLGVNSSGELFYAMKEVQGHAWTDSIDKVSLEENLDVIIKVTDAISYAHEKGIVHRDLKPDNIMIGQFGEVVVMDWGLALPTDKFKKQGMPITEGLAGTPSYMAPEMADLSLAPIGPAADIYLLGAQLFRAVARVAPHTGKHTGKHAFAALRAAAVNEIQWPTDTQSFDEELLDIARKAMATRPEDRYESALAFKQALRDYRSHSESRRLTAAARYELENAEATSNYRSFERAVASLEEAVKLWPDNDKASQLLQTARLRYAQVAYQKGDLDLAEGQLDENVEAHRELLRSIRQSRLEREAQAKRLRRMKQTAAALAAVVFLTVSVSAVLINSAREKEKLAKEQETIAREQETIAKTEAVQRFRESQSAIAELSGLADSLRDYPLAQAERQKLLEAVTSYYDRQTSEQSNVPELRYEQVQSLLRLGEVQNQLAQYSGALKTWARVITMSSELPSHLDSEGFPTLFEAKAFAGRAQTQFALGDLAGARKSNEEAIHEMNTAATKEFPSFSAEIASLQMQQALVEKAAGNYERGLKLAELAVGTLQSFADQNSDEGVLKELAVAHSIRSQILELTGEFADAASSTQQAIQTWQSLTTENPDNVLYADGLATSQTDSANIRRAAGHDPLIDYSNAVATFQQLVELRPGIPRYRFNLASALSGKAWTQNRLLQTDAAQETAVQALNTLLFLSERFPEDARFPLGEVSARLVLAEVLRDRGELDLAVGIIEQASEILGREEISPNLPQSRERYGELLLIFGQVQSSLGDSQLTQDSLQQSADVLLELADGESGLPRHRDSAAWALYYLAKELAADDPDAARTAVESAITLRNELPQRANWLDSFAWLLLHSPVDDLRDAERAEALASSAMKQAPENPRFSRTLALSQLRLGKVDEAAETLSKVSSLTASNHPENQLLSAIVAFRKQRQREAASLIAKATETIFANAPANPRLLQIQRDASSVTGIVIPVSEAGETAASMPTN